MKWIKYNILQNTINTGTESAPVYENVFLAKKIGYSDENLAIAQEEAYNGEYTVEEDDAYLRVGVYTPWCFASYLSFAGNVNASMVDAAFGKGNEDNIKDLGAALVMYSKFKGEALEFKALFDCDSLSDIEKSAEAMAEIVNSNAISELIRSSSYANGRLNYVKEELNSLLPSQYQRDSVAEMLTDTSVMGYMYDNYETFEASGILSSDEFINIANACANSRIAGSDIFAQTEVNEFPKKVLLISMKLSTVYPGNTNNSYYPWNQIGNKTKAVGYRPDGTTVLVSRQSVSSTQQSCDCTNIIKGKFASKVVQLPAGVSGTTGNWTQYVDFKYILCE